MLESNSEVGAWLLVSNLSGWFLSISIALISHTTYQALCFKITLLFQPRARFIFCIIIIVPLLLLLLPPLLHLCSSSLTFTNHRRNIAHRRRWRSTICAFSCLSRKSASCRLLGPRLNRLERKRLVEGMAVCCFAVSWILFSISKLITYKNTHTYITWSSTLWQSNVDPLPTLSSLYPALFFESSFVETHRLWGNTIIIRQPWLSCLVCPTSCYRPETSRFVTNGHLPPSSLSL